VFDNSEEDITTVVISVSAV